MKTAENFDEMGFPRGTMGVLADLAERLNLGDDDLDAVVRVLRQVYRRRMAQEFDGDGPAKAGPRRSRVFARVGA